MTETAHARRSDPDTSHDAADSIADLTAKQQAVLSVLKMVGPQTDAMLDEVYERMRVNRQLDVPLQSPSGIRSRRAELVARGLVISTGETVRLASGRSAIVWAAAPPGTQPPSVHPDQLTIT